MTVERGVHFNCSHRAGEGSGKVFFKVVSERLCSCCAVFHVKGEREDCIRDRKPVAESVFIEVS